MKYQFLKTVFFFLGVGLIAYLNSCGNQNQPTEFIQNQKEVFTHEDSVNAPVANLLDPPSFDFGTITEGTVVSHTFHLRNTGHSPLIITKIQTSCGCTTPNFSPKPVAIGDTTSFQVRFDSKGKGGPQTKFITVYSNTIPRIHKVILVGVVNAKPLTK